MSEVYIVAYAPECYSHQEHYPLKQAEGERGVPRWFAAPEEARAWAEKTFVEGSEWKVLRVEFRHEEVK